MVVRFVKKLAALGVPDDHIAAARLRKHRGRHFTGEGAFLAPGEVLPGDGHVTALGCFHGGRDGRKWRRDDDVAVAAIFHERKERREERARFSERLEHFPVAGDHRTARQSRPSKYSRVRRAFLFCPNPPPRGGEADGKDYAL